jgi:hypothetical protein
MKFKHIGDTILLFGLVHITVEGEYLFGARRVLCTRRCSVGSCSLEDDGCIGKNECGGVRIRICGDNGIEQSESGEE